MELRKIFKYRNVWIGVAMMWIVFVHSGFRFDSVFWMRFKEFGYGGVDICLFASGIGCYYSLEKDPDILRFLKRRIKRLGPTYLCFIIPWLWWTKKLSGLPIPAAIGNILGVQTLASWDYKFNWYISGLLVFYICMPYLKSLADTCEKWQQDVLVGLMFAVISVSFWNTGKNLIIIVTRLPVLYAGVVLAKMAHREYILKKSDCLLLGMLSVFGLICLLYCYYEWTEALWYCGLYWYPFALIVPGVCVFLSLLVERTEKYRAVRYMYGLLELIGVYSFEVYLVHIFMYEEFIPEISERFHIVFDNQMWLLTIPLIACGAFVMKRLGTFAGRLLEHIVAKKKA